MNIVLDVSDWQTPLALDLMLANADDEIIGVYIKATEGAGNQQAMARAFVDVCQRHNTPFGYYHLLTNESADSQMQNFIARVDDLPYEKLIPMLDREPSFTNLSIMPRIVDFIMNEFHDFLDYSDLAQVGQSTNRVWVAQYDRNSYYRPEQTEIDRYKSLAYCLWQFTSRYTNKNQDASVLLCDFDKLLREDEK